MIAVGDMVWYDDVLALVLDLDHTVGRERRVLIKDAEGLLMAAHMADLSLA